VAYLSYADLTSITEEILDLKQARRAVILAHHYQDAEIQDLPTRWRQPELHARPAIFQVTSSPSAAYGSWPKRLKS